MQQVEFEFRNIGVRNHLTYGLLCYAHSCHLLTDNQPLFIAYHYVPQLVYEAIADFDWLIVPIQSLPEQLMIITIGILIVNELLGQLHEELT